MTLRRLALCGMLAFVLCRPAFAQDVKQVGQTVISVDRRSAFPGGMMVVRLRNPRIQAGACSAILDGRREPFLLAPDGARALVPIPVGTPGGEATLGIEVRARNGIQRIPLGVSVAERSYRPRTVAIPPEKLPLLNRATRVRDGRYLLQMLRTITPDQLWRGPFRPPVEVPAVFSFGATEVWGTGVPADSPMDSVWGEYHRGLDYPAAVGTVVQAPAAGTVLLVASLTLTGQTLLIDHGQGVISAFFHLGRIDVQQGQPVEARAAVALSGDSGMAYAPHVHWGVYVHGEAVDPRALDVLE